MNIRQKTKKLGIYVLVLLVLSISVLSAPIFDSVFFEDPLPIGISQNFIAKIISNDALISVIIEIDSQNYSMNKVSSEYEFLYMPQNEGNNYFKIYAEDNLSQNTIYQNLFEVKDLTPPEIISTKPQGINNNSLQTLIVITDENSICRFSDIDEDFYDMGYVFSGEEKSHTYALTNLEDGIKDYYVRCKDSADNQNLHSIIISFEIDTTPPEILSKSPETVVNTESENLEVITSEDSECKYDTGNYTYKNMRQFFKNSGGTVHNTILTHLSSGERTYYIACKDKAENIVYSKMIFEVNLPASAEIILSSESPLKADTYEIEIITSKPLSLIPNLQYKYDDETTSHEISLTGQDSEWSGFLVVEKGEKDKIGKFYFSGKDYDGLTGSKITKGEMFVVDTIKPPAPTSIDIIIEDDDIELSFFYDGEETNKFNVYRRTSEGVEYTDYYEYCKKNPFIDENPESGKKYYYRIAAVDKAGNIGDLSSEVNIFLEEDDDYDTDAEKSTNNLLDSKFENELNSTLSEIKTLSFDIDFAISKLEKTTDRFENEIIKELKLIEKSATAKSNVGNVQKEIENIRNSDLTEEEFNKKIENINIKIGSIKEDSVIEINTLDSMEFTEDFTESDVNYAIDEIFINTNLENDLRENYTKSAYKLLDNINVFQRIIVARIKYLSDNEEIVTLVQKEISSSSEELNVISLEIIPKDFKENAKDIVFSNTPKVLKEDPIVYWNYPKFQNIKYSYYIDEKRQISDVKDSRTLILPEPSKFVPKIGVYTSEDNDDKLTGNFVFENNVSPIKIKEYIFIGFGVIIIISLMIYYFFYIKDPIEFEDSFDNNKISYDLLPNLKVGASSPWEEKGGKKSLHLQPKGRNIGFSKSKQSINEIKNKNDSELNRDVQTLLHHINYYADNLNFEKAKKEYNILYGMINSNPNTRKNTLSDVRTVFDKISIKQKLDNVQNSIDMKKYQDAVILLKDLKSKLNFLTDNGSKITPLSDYLKEYYSFYLKQLQKRVAKK